MGLHRRLAVAVAAATASSVLGGLVALPPAGAADVRSSSVAKRAIDFIAGQQRSDGGFGDGEAGFPGFETPDAVLAIADAAEVDLTYDADAARARVRSIKRNGRDGLGYLDDLADGGVDAGKAAQLVMVAKAVGLSPTAFDPDGDGATNLLAVIDAARNPDGTYGTYFNSTVQVALAFAAAGRVVPNDTVGAIKAAQQPSGGYDFSGDPNGSPEIDTTGRVIQALVAAKVPATDASVDKAIKLLVQRQNNDGSWSAFGSPDPNSTAVAVLALQAAGFDPVRYCRTVPDHAPPATSADEFLRKAQASDGRIASPNDSYGVNTFATSQSVQALLRAFQPIASATPATCPTTGYRVVTSDGGVFTFGDASFHGSTGGITLNRPVVATASTPSGKGYWLFASDGGVFTFGDAPFLGSTGGMNLNKPIVAAAATPTGGGYWLFASDGGVFTFGDAPFLGSTGSVHLNRPIVGAASTPSGRGYWLFASDGGVFTFGDAGFYGSTGGMPLNEPVIGGAASLGGRGYELFAADGGVFAFGDASFLGSASSTSKRFVAGARSDGEGYYLVATDGTVSNFGAPSFGQPGGTNAPAVAIQTP